jgi:hypothetical protein
LREGDVIASVMAVPVSEDEEVATDVVVAEGAEVAAEPAAVEQTQTQE